MDYQEQQDFFAWEAQSRDTIDFKTVYVDMADDLMAGLLLSQLVYWHLPKKDGSSRMRVSKEGNLWVAKTRTEWWAETRLKPRQVDRASKILVKKGLVFTNLWKFAGSPTTHWRINWNAFLPSLKKEAERWKENCILPKREIQQTKALLTNDETVTSFLTETVAENAAQIDQPAQISPLGEPPEPDSPSQQTSPTPPEPPTVPVLTLGRSPQPPQPTEPATPGGRPDSVTITDAEGTLWVASDDHPDDETITFQIVPGITALTASGDATAPDTPPEPPTVPVLTLGRSGAKPPRDYLTDLLAYAKRRKPGDSDTHVRPKHWESVSDDEYAICRRVAQLWCGGRLPFPGSIEAHCGAAGWLLHDLNGGNLSACVRALDEYHLHYEAERMTFTVAGPKSLVAVLPAFLAAEGGGGEPGVIRVGG